MENKMCQDEEEGSHKETMVVDTTGTRREKQAVLVTGGAGFIGSHTADFLLGRGDDVILLDNINDYYDQRIKRSNVKYLQEKYGENRCRFVEGDFTDEDTLKRIFDEMKPDKVCHLGARAGVRPSISQPFLYIKVNIEGTVRIFEQAVKSGVKHVVYASSSSVYGGSKKDTFSETDRDDVRPVSQYAATKKACELMAHTYNHLYGLHVTGLRFFTVYGPRGRPDMAAFKFIKRIVNGVAIDRYGDGSSERDWTFVSDIVNGIVRSLDRPLGYQVFNLGNGNPIKLNDFIEIAHKEVQRGLGGKKVPLLINQKPDQPGDVPRTSADVSLAKRLLGYEPRVSLAQGLRQTVEWYVKTYVSKTRYDEICSSTTLNQEGLTLPHTINRDLFPTENVAETAEDVRVRREQSKRVVQWNKKGKTVDGHSPFGENHFMPRVGVTSTISPNTIVESGIKLPATYDRRLVIESSDDDSAGDVGMDMSDDESVVSMIVSSPESKGESKGESYVGRVQSRLKSVTIGTRIYRSEALSSQLAEANENRIAEDIVRLGKFIESASRVSGRIAIAVNSAGQGGQALLRDVQDLSAVCAKRYRCEVECVAINQWGRVVPALNALVNIATRWKSKHLLLASSEVRMTPRAARILQRALLISPENRKVRSSSTHHIVSDTLVAGAMLSGHDFKPDQEDGVTLNAVTCPWNTAAMWNLDRLALTGFLNVSEHEDASGMEEVAVVAMHQRLWPHLSCTKLVALPNGHIEWSSVTAKRDGQERVEYHRRKMASKRARSNVQIKKLAFPSSSSTTRASVMHVDMSRVTSYFENTFPAWRKAAADITSTALLETVPACH